jgi:hypothetical protein
MDAHTAYLMIYRRTTFVNHLMCDHSHDAYHAICKYAYHAHQPMRMNSAANGFSRSCRSRARRPAGAKFSFRFKTG